MAEKGVGRGDGLERERCATNRVGGWTGGCEGVRGVGGVVGAEVCAAGEGPKNLAGLMVRISRVSAAFPASAILPERLRGLLKDLLNLRFPQKDP